MSPPIPCYDDRMLDLEKIASEYEQSLVIPSHKPVPPLIILPVGRVGAGKTTVMKPLCEKLSLLRISTDEIRLLIQDHAYFDTYPQQIAISLAKKYIELGYSIGIDANCSSIWQSPALTELLISSHLQSFWINVNPPEEYIIQKLTHHPPSKLFKNTAEALSCYQLSKQKVITTGIPFIYEFDPARADLEQQISEAIHKIKTILKSN